MRIARCGDLTHAEVTADFHISIEPVRRWVREADIDRGGTPAVVPAPSGGGWAPAALVAVHMRTRERYEADSRPLRSRA